MSSQDKGGVRLETVSADQAGQRLDNFLARHLKGVPRSMVYRLIRTGQVRINGGRCKPSRRLECGDVVRIPPARTAQRDEIVVPERAVELLRERVLYRDDDLLVIDKPSGMAVRAGSGLAWGVIDVLRQIEPGAYVELAHRLDRETSGCLVLARNGAALKVLSAQFREGRVDKRYLCLLHGRLAEAVVEVDAPLARVAAQGGERAVEVVPEGKPARTRFRLLEAYRDASYVEAELLTGRTHQIRAHARHLGMPLAGDGKYASRESARHWRSLGLKRIFLHAHALEIEGADGESQHFSCPLPDELRKVLDRSL